MSCYMDEVYILHVMPFDGDDMSSVKFLTLGEGLFSYNVPCQ